MVRIISLLIAAAALAGCQQVNSLAVEEGESAFACVKANSDVPFMQTGGIMIEVGQTDTTAYTAEDWRTLAEICD